MPNRFTLINQTLENCLTAGMARGLYYQAYFELIERIGGEVMGELDGEVPAGKRVGLTNSEVVYIAARVEEYLRKAVFREAGSRH